MPATDEDPPRRRTRMDRAAMASNWRQVLLADAAVGVFVVLVGVVVGVLVAVPIGAVLVIAGVAYLVGGLRRWRRWTRLRAAAGLDHRGHDDTSP